MSVSRFLEPLSEFSVLDVLPFLRARLGSNPCVGPHVGVDGAAPVLCAAPLRPPADTKGGLARLGSPSNKLSTPSSFPSNSVNAASPHHQEAEGIGTRLAQRRHRNPEGKRIGESAIITRLTRDYTIII